MRDSSKVRSNENSCRIFLEISLGFHVPLKTIRINKRDRTLSPDPVGYEDGLNMSERRQKSARSLIGNWQGGAMNQVVIQHTSRRVERASGWLNWKHSNRVIRALLDRGRARPLKGTSY